MSACFSDKVPCCVMEKLKEVSSHPIFELEILPILCSVILWQKGIASKQCVFYLDNEAAQGALIKGSTETMYASKMISLFTELEMDLQIKSWIARVPTSSNPADKPSRGDLSEMIERHISADSIPWEEVWMKVLER